MASYSILCNFKLEEKREASLVDWGSVKAGLCQCVVWMLMCVCVCGERRICPRSSVALWLPSLTVLSLSSGYSSSLNTATVFWPLEPDPGQIRILPSSETGRFPEACTHQISLLHLILSGFLSSSVICVFHYISLSRKILIILKSCSVIQVKLYVSSERIIRAVTELKKKRGEVLSALV